VCPGERTNVSGHVSREIHDLKQSGMGVPVYFNPEPHPAPAHHRAIPRGDNRAAELKVRHALRVSRPNPMQCFALCFV